MTSSGASRVAAASCARVQRVRRPADLRRGLYRLSPRPGGAQAYFGVQADMVVYGKTVAGGMPIGVVCGKAPLMRDSIRNIRCASPTLSAPSRRIPRDGRDERVSAWVTPARQRRFTT